MKKSNLKDGKKKNTKGKRFKEKSSKKQEEVQEKDKKLEEPQENEKLEELQENQKTEETQENEKLVEPKQPQENEKLEETQKNKELEEGNSDEKQDKNEEKKETVVDKSHNNKKIKKIICVTTIAIILIAVGIFVYLMFRPKFKDAKIELGTKEINIDMFLVSSMYKNNAEIVTDISQVDLNTVGEKEIILSYNGKEQTVVLSIVDTTPPKVTFQDLKKYTDYEINAEDFIVEKTDLSEMIVTILEKPEDISNYGDYKIKISVKDAFGNETIGECILTIAWLKPELTIELGTELKLEDLILNVEQDGDKIPQSELDKVNTSVVGEYEIKATYDGKEYTSKIKVQDTTPPELELRNITIYNDEKVEDYTSFITKVSDISGEPTTTLKTEIDYTKIGTQDIVIEAVDVNGNKVEKTATLTIQIDEEGPVISGLTEISVKKNSSIDYYAGVSATDDKDGWCQVTVDSSAVNLAAAGTYYATYTSKDETGNTTTRKRKITVEHNEEDTIAKLDAFYNNYCAGKDSVGLAQAVREQIGYNSNWGGDDPIWYGLTVGSGNCYVHAVILQQVLNRAGYENQIIYRLDRGHYWNLVKVGGVWRHLDGTPSVNHTLGLLTDDEKWNDVGLHGIGWDKTKWPAAE